MSDDVPVMSGLDGLFARPGWQADAACRGGGVARWFPEKGQPNLAEKALCAGCTVRAECLEAALANNEKFGVWGGLSTRERLWLRRSRRLSVAEVVDLDSRRRGTAA